jgi:hypothetical protein
MDRRQLLADLAGVISASSATRGRRETAVETGSATDALLKAPPADKAPN